MDNGIQERKGQEMKINSRVMPHGFSSALLAAALLMSCRNKPQASPPETPDTAPQSGQPDAGVAQVAATEGGNLDPIGKVEAYVKDSTLWTNGISPKIDLPASAKPEEVLAAFLEKASFDKGKVTSPKIVATRAIVTSSAGDNPYTAVYFESEQGNYVIVMHHEGGETGWWTKAFEPEKLGPPPK
jgi:hypothetical protein